MTGDDKEEGRRQGRVDTRLDVLEKALDEIKSELKAARGFVWKALAAVIGMLAAQWAKIMGFWQ